VFVDHRFDLVSVVPSIGERSANGSGKRRSMERWEHRPILACRAKRLVQSIERIACLWWEWCFLVSLVLAEYDERASFEIDVTPADPAPALVVGIAKDLPAAHT
jgi:hypothetical protein